MKKGKDYIVFPLDFDSKKEAFKYVKLLDGKVGVFKIGLELFIKEGPDVIRSIKKMTNARIFLDLKLHDISVTVQKAMLSAVSLGVDMITVHCSSLKMLEMAALGGAGQTQVLGVTLLTDNDTDDLKMAGFKDGYCDDVNSLVLKRAQMAHQAGCAGIICSGKEVEKIKSEFGKNFLCVTPGIRPGWSSPDNDDQKRITTPGMAVKSGSDLIVVGRPIREANDPVKAAQKIVDEIEKAL
ncbi:MAG: orotidine-5'-phosphate decarboxylase [Desulfobacteraceae bacterium]|nr:orotidine-5'-phosphate decarboxylase [Desulfobacteraceae bacterium]